MLEPSPPDCSGAAPPGGPPFIVADAAMQRLYALVERLAVSDMPVLVSGETGVGKEIAATALHRWSGRSGPLLVIHCAALQGALVDGGLFGHAGGGTVFLDEVGELSLAAQAKLLPLVERRHERAADIRLVATTHRDLGVEVRAGRFRRDLYFRLSAATVWLPPLRERRREVLVLARRFLHDACARLQRRPMSIGEDAAQALLSHRWPGNVRELKNVMEYVAAAAEGDVLQRWHLPARLAAPRKPVAEEIRELERARMAEALAHSGGNRTRAAAMISMPLRTFLTKLKVYRLGGREPARARGERAVSRASTATTP
jgi:DNA-binding NtrC family response regulator